MTFTETKTRKITLQPSFFFSQTLFYSNNSVIGGKWTDEREKSFQSVASSTKDRIQIRDLKTGKDIVLTRAEVIAKFREDRYNDVHGFDVNDTEM